MTKTRFWAILVSLAMLISFVPYALADSEEIFEENGSVIEIEPGTDEGDLSAEGLLGETEPFVPENVERLIINSDSRVEVSNPWSYPFSTIACMHVSASCGCSWQGTGFMVGADRMLTAAHCLVCSTHGKWANSINFYFGYRGRSYSYLYSGRWTAYAGTVYRTPGSDHANDYGLIRFAEDIGNTTGWLGTRWGLSEADLTTRVVYVAGYRDADLEYDVGLIDSASSQNLYYTMDQVSGNSGGPIFDTDNYAVGIIVGSNGSWNVGHRLTSVMRDYLDSLSF